MTYYSGSGATATSLSRVLRVSGKLYVDPTSLTSPYGGTMLGRVASGVVLSGGTRLVAMNSRVNAGNRPHTMFYNNLGPITLTAVLSEWDADVLRIAFPLNRDAGTSEDFLNFPGSGVAGPETLSASTRVVVMFVPDSEDGIHPGAILYEAVGHIDAAALHFSALRETHVTVTF